MARPPQFTRDHATNLAAVKEHTEKSALSRWTRLTEVSNHGLLIISKTTARCTRRSKAAIVARRSIAIVVGCKDRRQRALVSQRPETPTPVVIGSAILIVPALMGNSASSMMRVAAGSARRCASYCRANAESYL